MGFADDAPRVSGDRKRTPSDARGLRPRGAERSRREVTAHSLLNSRLRFESGAVEIGGTARRTPEGTHLGLGRVGSS
jgi:hypothetical protein